MIKLMIKNVAMAAVLFAMTGCASKIHSNNTPVDKPKDSSVDKGVVCFTFTIMPDSTTADAKIYKSEPLGYFDSEAQRVFAKWKFQPPIVDGKAVAKPGAKYCLDFKLDEPIVGAK